MKQQHVDIHKAITTLSCALDLVGVDEIRHGKRVAVIARAIALHLNWPEPECLSILYAGMLHDCGVSKIHEHRQLTATLEWDGAEEHCIRGAAYLSACQPLAHLSTEIRYHHTRWENLLEIPIDHYTRLRANLLFLADRIDVLQAHFLNNSQILTEYPTIIARIKSLSGILFAPELVDAFSEIANVEAFWLAMEPEYLDEDLRHIGRDIAASLIDITALKELARLFSRVVDAKSPYTDEHSHRVAQIARQLAADFGIEDCQLDQIEIAGLLHDIGKLRVSEDIIDKPGGLTPDERATMHRHSYDTFRILQRVFDDSKIPLWAGFHHETLIGDGYPFKNNNKELDIECRIITVADIFQALAQERPYRRTMSLEYILNDLHARVASGHLDGNVVAKLTENAELYYRLAVA
ncbi:MAG: HD domain-containing protein [Methylobacter sp.]|nr:HD domain-containing protein [Methylobacter sp.]MDP2098759.1 HD domain-containing protein [Methylobacter sp.]MDP2430140.1 HD domain-containing protein [Methylobacter sp.]MDP3054281.1 HD domain-containing protein [Methylobacter sp.]MDP3363743.1 HD domain-containing protein [Methylobacter sp.]